MYNKLHFPAAIRFFHALPSKLAFNIFINGTCYFQNVKFKEVSSFLSLPRADYEIEIYSIGEQSSPFICQELRVESGTLATVILYRTKEEFKLLPIYHDTEVPIGEAKMRFIHLAEEFSTVDVKATFGDVIFPHIHFMNMTKYLGLSPMTVNLEIRKAGTKNILLPLPKLVFKPNHIYSLVLLKNDSEERPYEVIVLTDYLVDL
ncbi:DUF4397 domain-containing protein [Cytobacillus sp. Hz8]|uniref:DUF4397 domain-containing protein n=1 Tax=Cytobacillus sp. Hz8 TaxID=3347168 RepID=UPI0035DF1BBA